MRNQITSTGNEIKRIKAIISDLRLTFISLGSIGRVGRAERMGLAISFVSNVPEKVWFHGDWCSSRGKGCNNSKLTSEKGCCIWYDEQQVIDTFCCANLGTLTFVIFLSVSGGYRGAFGHYYFTSRY